MTTQTMTWDRAQTGRIQLIAALALGLSLLFLAGFAGADIIHDAAHDTRHATAFPCH